MTRLVWTLNIRHLTTHPLRLLLSVTGIASGVGLAVGVAALGSSIDASVSAAAEAAATRANVEVRAMSGTGLPMSLLEEVRAAPGVRAAGAAIEWPTKVRSRTRTSGIVVLGVDDGLLELAPRAIDASSMQAGDPFGLFVPSSLARELGVTSGATVEIASAAGWRPIAVNVVAFQGRTAAAAIGVVAELAGRPGRADVLYLDAADESAVRRLVSTRGETGPVAAGRTRQLDQLLGQARASMQVGTIVALFVGGFLVFNTMAMAAVERTAEVALVRAVGGTRRQVFALLLAEGGVLGAVGSAAGLASGAALASVLFTSQGEALRNVAPIEITRFVVRSGDLAAAGAAGLAASLFASWFPARRSAAADPVAGLGPAGSHEDRIERPRRATAVAGTAMFAAGLALAIAFLRSDDTRLALVSVVVTMTGAALLIRHVVPAVARAALRPAARETAPAIVRMAAGEVLRAPGRTAFTAGAVLLALSLIVGFSIGLGSFTATFRRGFERILRADLYVRAATFTPFATDVPIDPAVLSEVRTVPGVAVAYPFRSVTATIRGQVVLLLAWDHEAYARLPGLDAATRREAEATARALAAPDAVAIAPSVPRVLGFEVGDTIDLPTPSGTRPVRVTRRIADPSSIPTVFVDHRRFADVWGTETASVIPVGIAPDADPLQVQRAIADRLGGRYDVRVDTRAEYQDWVFGIIAGFQGMLYSVQLIAVIVAGLGLANTLLISTLERRRDLGVLRALGMLRRQLRRQVTLEAVAVGAIGVSLAWVLGTFVGLFMHRIIRAQVGLEMPLVLPPAGYIAVALLGIGGAAAAALYPAHRAARMDVVEALQYE